MAYRTLISKLALLALTAGCFGWAGPAKAGDKIEFSDPGVLLDVPQPERDVKQDANTSISHAFSGGGGATAEPFIPASTTIIIPARKQGGLGWQSPFEDDQKRQDGQESSALDLFAPEKTAEHTNSWGSSDEKQRGLRDVGMMDFTHGASRFGTDSSEKDAGFREDGIRSRFSDHDTFDLSHQFSSHGPIAEQRMREGEFVPGNEKFRAMMYAQPGAAFSRPDPLDQADPLRDSAFSGSPENSPDESMRDERNAQQSFVPPTTMRAWDESTAAHAQHQREEEAASAQSRGPSAPAVLPWPKQPGSLFQ